MSQKTKQALAEALKSLLKQKSIDKITVKELAGLCSVNRQTFYYHFQDIYELLGWIYRTEALAAIEHEKTYDTWQQGLLKILEYVQENRALCINTYRSLAREHLESYLDAVLNHLLGDVVDELGRTCPAAEEQKRFITKFYSYAFAGVLLDWIATGIKTPAADLAEQISTIMDGAILQAMKRMG